MCNIPQSAEQSNNNNAGGATTSPSRQPNAAYALFLHREELRRRKVHTSRASMTKIQLTNELITKTKQNIGKCSFEDLEIMARETLFKKNLQRSLHYRRMQMQAWLQAKRQSKGLQ